MKGKSAIPIVLILAITTFAVATIHTRALIGPPYYVKFYLWNPVAGSNIFIPQLPGTNVPTWLYIDSPVSWADTALGIVGVTASLRVDPNVVTVITAAPMADSDYNGRPDSFLGNYAASQGYYTLWVGGTVNATTGTIIQPAEAISGFTTLGKGAGGGPAPLFMFIIQTAAGVDPATAYSLLHLFDCYYTTADGVTHPVDVVEDGHYGTPPPQYHMSGVPPIDPLSPIGSTWHELYPTYCNYWTLTSWEDNGDGYLSASDQIDMLNATGWTLWFHVDAVTTTIHWTFKDPIVGEGVAEPPDFTEEIIRDPIGTTWHQIYPDYCRWFNITSWEDTGLEPGVFDPSDQFDFEYFDEPGVTYWAHLDEVTTDIILSFKYEEPPIPEFPLGIGLMMAIASAIPIVYLLRRRKKVVEK